MISYWERETFLPTAGVCIIGSGIVGLTTAIAIKERYRNLDVLILERGFLPSGASTKNAGFCCFGSITELVDDLTRMTESEVFALVERRWKGLHHLRSMVGDGHMEYEESGGFEVFKTKEEFQEFESKMDYFNRQLEKIVGKGVYTSNPDKITESGVKEVAGIIENKYEGQINTGKMMKTLMDHALHRGVRIFNGITVKQIHDTGSQVEIETDQAGLLKATQLIVTNNGFAKSLLKDLDIAPARAQVLITKPIEGLKLKGSFHYDKGYYYFRNVDNRVLLGGGRNLDFKGETTTQFGLTPQIQESLEELLKNMILPYANFEIDMRWSGIMGVGPVKKTIVEQVSPCVYCGVRMGGMGVALGALVGEELAQLIER